MYFLLLNVLKKEKKKVLWSFFKFFLAFGRIKFETLSTTATTLRYGYFPLQLLNIKTLLGLAIYLAETIITAEGDLIQNELFCYWSSFYVVRLPFLVHLSRATEIKTQNARKGYMICSVIFKERKEKINPDGKR